jgi:hypothetical protein
MIRSGIPEWSPPGACGVREAKTIAALARCYPGLTFESDANRASGRKRRVRVVVRNAGRKDTHRDDQHASVRTPTRAVLGGDPSTSSASPAAAAAAAAAAARAAAIAAPAPTRREFLDDPDRLARVAAATGRGRGRGGDRRERIDPGKRGEGRRVPPASERGRRRDRLDRDSAAGRRAPVSFVSAGTRGGEDPNGGNAGEFESAESESAAAAAATAAAARRARMVADSASLDDFGAFERHTSGFGGRVLAGMGFVPGEGLGRDGRGVAAPLEAKERPARRGLGAE